MIDIELFYEIKHSRIADCLLIVASFGQAFGFVGQCLSQFRGFAGCRLLDLVFGFLGCRLFLDFAGLGVENIFEVFGFRGFHVCVFFRVAGFWV